MQTDPLGQIALLAVTLLTSSCSSSSGGGGSDAALIGIGFHASTQIEHVLKLDPSTGTLADLGPLPPQYTFFQTCSNAFDRASNHIYQVGAPETLLTIDATTGALLGAQPLALGAYANFMGPEVNNAGEIIGMSWEEGAKLEHVVKLDPATGTLTDLGSLPPQYTSFQTCSNAFDRASNHIYQVGAPKTLLTIDAATGALLGAQPLALGSYANFMGPEVNNAGELIGMSWEAGTKLEHVVKLDPATGTLTDLGALPPQFMLFQVDARPFASASNHIYPVSAPSTLLTIDAATGALLGTQPLALGMYKNFINMEAVP